ncbi:MAG TPA: hypothetical protein VJ697_13150 [Nitrososphaeraceae archaeon]|nr:hypothetical protein [Nitrososphaeraceae archaeon]
MQNSILKSYERLQRLLIDEETTITENNSKNNISIPLDPQEFYKDFGYLLHPKNGEPVQNLTDYQYNIWNDKYHSKYRLVLKSQKVGITTSTLLEDFHDAITRFRGHDILIIAQSQNHANEHLRTLKNLILNSDKYRQFLITNPSELLLKEEKSKVSVCYIHNPDNPFQPSRIIALGSSESGIWSWKNVSKIHMSDIAATQIVDDSSLFAAAFSRLANTDGSFIIETPPRGARGHVYEIYEQINKGESEFSLHIVRADQAVEAGLISADFLIAERQRLGPLYPQYYAAEFIEGISNLFSQVSIDRAIEAGRLYDPDNYYLEQSEKYLLCDPGYGSSAFSVTVCQFVMNSEGTRKQIQILHSDQLERPTVDQSLDYIFQLIHKYKGIKNIGIDASAPELVSTIKKKINEKYDYQWVKEKLSYCKKNNLDPARYMIVLPIVFNTESKLDMTLKTRRLLDDSRQLVAINPRFQKLITSLKSAVFDSRGMLDKTLTPFDDILESFMLLTNFFNFKSSGDY